MPGSERFSNLAADPSGVGGRGKGHEGESVADASVCVCVCAHEVGIFH